MGDLIPFGWAQIWRCLQSGHVAERCQVLAIAMDRGDDAILLVAQALGHDPAPPVRETALALLLRCDRPVALGAIWHHLNLPPLDNLGAYQCLQGHLAQRAWQAADDLTLDLILRTARRSGRWLQAADLAQISPPLLAALTAIDQLWRLYSGDRFGFSVQAQLWRDCVAKTCRPMAYDRENLCDCFGEQVGWTVRSYRGRYVPDYTFERQPKIPHTLDAPRGNLPSTFALGGGKPERDYDPPDTESTMGFYSPGFYYYTWSPDAFFGHALLDQFFKHFEGDLSAHDADP